MAASLFKWFLAGILCLSIRETGFSGPGQDPFAVPEGRLGTGIRHPLYIGVTEIRHNAKEKILEVSCKLFTNDFEAALEKVAKAKVDLSSPKDKKITDKLIDDYVEKHLQLKCDGRPVSLHFIGSEKETDGTWSYFQVNDIPSVRRIEVTNSLLYDSFDQQINIIHATVGEERKSVRLNYPDVNTSFEF
jgi:hypothetical protein